MSEAIRRNRNQVFSRFLPGAVMTIDGETVQVKRHSILGVTGDASSEAYLRRLLVDEVQKWLHRDPTYRSLLADPDSSDFELVTTNKVHAEPVDLYECKQCKAVQRPGNGSTRGKCRRCGGELRVLPFILVHTCGRMKPLRIPECKTHKTDWMILERHGKQRWRCGECGYTEPAVGGSCGKDCTLVLQKAFDPDDRAGKAMKRRAVSDPGVHNAQILTVLNPPGRGLADLLKDFEHQAGALFLAEYLGILPEFARDPEVAVMLLRDIQAIAAAPSVPEQDAQLIEQWRGFGLSDEQIAMMLKQVQAKVEKANPRLVQAKQLENVLSEAEKTIGPEGIGGIEPALQGQVRDSVLAARLAGMVTLKAVADELAATTGPRAVYASRVADAGLLLTEMGMAELYYLPQLPIRSAAYGFTRVENRPSDTVLLKPFDTIPSNKNNGQNVVPIFVADSKTEALCFRLSSARMIAWLVANGWVDKAEAAALDSEQKRRAWLLRQQQVVAFDSNPESFSAIAWAIPACIHSVSHLLMGQIASQSSFGETSLSEMVLPATLSTLIYVNQRSDFSLGGLRTFLEQRLDVALRASLEDEGCMLDPNCEEDGGACVGCLFVPEVSCRLLNVALSRHLLFGGPATGDLATVMSGSIVGYFDPNVASRARQLFNQ